MVSVAKNDGVNTEPSLSSPSLPSQTIAPIQPPQQSLGTKGLESSTIENTK